MAGLPHWMSPHSASALTERVHCRGIAGQDPEACLLALLPPARLSLIRREDGRIVGDRSVPTGRWAAILAANWIGPGLR